ncbi:MAG TPA: di-heme oxidoredictase family protein, partial [Polyangiales bacterium]|nr:di-heme oxidoredictase family protein [Polyangiales bacterium]
LFDMVSFVMLLAAPSFSALDPCAANGGAVFDAIGCADCHTPRLDGPRGPLPVYSDLLLHDLGADLADGVTENEAQTQEFRTPPLWGLAAVGPYLHDGRASTVAEAISWHGGEAQRARDAFVALPAERRDDLLAFLDHLGGREQASAGLLAPHAPAPAASELGGPIAGLSPAELSRFQEARSLFDREFRVSTGVGSPRFNGDSCRACHFDPVLGGSGPRDVNVLRHGALGPDGAYVEPSAGSILHRASVDFASGVAAESGTSIFELRQTPHLFGGGLIESISSAAIAAAEDPDDANGDGVSGRAAWLADGRLGRFGWKAQIPSLLEFVRDAATSELGLTVPAQPDTTFGRTTDSDGTADPELSQDQQALLLAFLTNLAPPPRALAEDPAAAAQGEQLFAALGCSSCHTPALEGAAGPVALYSDLLLHELALDKDKGGIPEGAAERTEYRTAPLWGIRLTNPYMHDGAAETLSDAILQHAGEAADSGKLFAESTDADKHALLVFLSTL